MKYPCMFTCTGSAQSSGGSVLRDVRNHILKYLDETGKVRLYTKVERRDVLSFLDPNDPQIVLQDDGGFRTVTTALNFKRGLLYLGGYLRDDFVLAGGSDVSPDGFAKDAWVDAVARQWVGYLRGYRGYREGAEIRSRHNFALSVSEESMKELSKFGFSIPDFLRTVLDESLEKFVKSQGYPAGDRFGYVYGFHLDTNHIHIQFSILPRTEQGKLVRLTPFFRSDAGKRSGGRFMNNPTQYACESYNGLLEKYLGVTELLKFQGFDFGTDLLTASYVYKSCNSLLRGGQFRTLGVDIEKGLSARLGVSCDRTIEALIGLYVSWDGKKKPEPVVVDYSNLDSAGYRRLTRLWCGLEFLRLVEDRKRKLRDDGDKVLPPYLVQEFKDFWSDFFGVERLSEFEYIEKYTAQMKLRVGSTVKDYTEVLLSNDANFFDVYSGNGDLLGLLDEACFEGFNVVSRVLALGDLVLSARYGKTSLDLSFMKSKNLGVVAKDAKGRLPAVGVEKVVTTPKIPGVDSLPFS